MDTTSTETDLGGTKRPSLFKILIPFVIAGGILYWVFSSVDIENLKDIFATVPLWVCLVAMAGATLGILIGDMLSFGNCYRWFLVKSIQWWDILCIRSTIFLLLATFSPLAPILPLGYFYKRWQIPIFRTFSMGLIVIFLDGYAGSALIAAAMFMSDQPIAWYWKALVAGHWLFLAAVLTFYFSRFRDSKIFGEPLRALFFAFRLATFKQYVFIYGSRLFLIITQVIAVKILLDTLNIQLQLWQIFIFVPLFYGSAFLPISAGGYGGPQGAAILFLVEVWNVTDSETALVFSLIWSTMFLLCRVVLGMTFLFPMWKAFNANPQPMAQPAT